MAVENYGERLKYLRERAGLSQHELAARTVVSVEVISRIEYGQNPELPELFKLAAGLNTTIGALSGVSEVRERITYRPLCVGE